MLIKEIYQKNVIFIVIGILKILVFKYEPYLWNGCHDSMRKAVNFNNIAIVYIKGNAYRINFWYISKR